MAQNKLYTQETNMIVIFNYLDYRKFIKDIFIEKKKVSKNFSHRAVLQRMGISSTGYIANVMALQSFQKLIHVRQFNFEIGRKMRKAGYCQILLNPRVLGLSAAENSILAIAILHIASHGSYRHFLQSDVHFADFYDYPGLRFHDKQESQNSFFMGKRNTPDRLVTSVFAQQ